MKKIIILACCLFGCLSPEEAHNQEYRFNKDINGFHIKQIIYSKDSRTGLCYASMSLGSNWAVLTNVPCTPEVEKLIQ